MSACRDTYALAKAYCASVLELFVDQDLLEPDVAATEQHGGPNVGTGPPALAAVTMSNREIRLRWAELLRRTC